MNAFNQHGVDAAAGSSGGRGEEVHQESGVNAGSEYADVVRSGGGIDRVGKFGVRGPGVRQFLASRDDVDTGFDDGLDLWPEAVEFRDRGDDGHVWSGSQGVVKGTGD